jgi:UDP-N-acetylglucosamine:LPS N-acetylglucosamine transferase
MIKKKHKICLVSSSGGHWEQLKKLQPLVEKYGGFYVTEKTRFKVPQAKYLMYQTDLKDKWMLPKMVLNSAKALLVWIKEKPDIVITTGTLVAYPFYLLSILLRKRFVFIETFGRANMPTVAGRLMEKHSDLFIVQWETQKKYYKKAVYVGCLY